MTDLFETMRTAGAIRRYREEEVPDDVLVRCLEAATWAPSGSNRQGWRFVVLRSPEIRAILGPAYRKGWSSMGAAYGLAEIDPTDDSPRARMGRSMQHFVDHFEEIPAYVLFCMEGRGREPQLTDGASVYPAMQNFLLACRAEGLGAVVTMWHQFAEPELRAAVGIPDDVALAALVPVGWPEGRHGPVRRRPVGEVAYLDTWGRSLTGP